MQNSTSHGAVCPSCGNPIVADERQKIFDKLPERGYVRQKLLIPHLLSFSSATLWRKVASGEFPAPVKLSARITAWRIDEVKKWLQEH
jgi:predicted DNA-binding transcriptional regulator AlpA